MQRPTRFLYCCLVMFGSCWVGLGNGFRLPDQDARATARGEAFAATADNASAIYYNPGGIGLLPGHNARIGVYGLAFDTRYESPSGQSAETEEELNLIPHFFYSYGAKDLPVAVGLGLYAPFGLSVEWPETTGFRSVALESKMTYLTVNPVIAWRVLTNLSIAAGPTFNWGDIDLKRGMTAFPYNDSSTLTGDGMAYGFNAGVIWQPHPMLSLGATYRSKTEVEYDGSTEIRFVVPPPGYPQYLKMNAKAKVPTPQSIAGGISFRPTPKWNIEADVDWTDWSQLGTIKIQQMIPSELALKWQSSFYYEFGVTRYFGEGWHVSGGYIYNENSVPDKTFNPWVPDQDRHFLSVGLGFQGEYFSFDVAYQFGYGPNRRVTGSELTPAGQNADGEYEYDSHAFAVTLGFRF